ncbi:hypothetical protein OM076_13590 [Solirubrobacter ginsenosidimutans]|uniref:Uncharacterized protein n=1 Tax=Solirubrobacter ginsenosidimutans TaxID=490573 RepID=A0A9X3MRU4_9ACTN|nr:hypothetical protein [Solirubrobacter ginsenosidimutans]MDA0161305.1 hypothetical protein [Solirubrobacter ginsenosidimutans]
MLVNNLRRSRRRSLRLPGTFDLQSVLKGAPPAAQPAPAKRRKDLAALVQRFGKLTAAVDELTAVSGEQFVRSTLTASPRKLPAKELRPIEIFTKALAKGNTPQSTVLLARARRADHDDATTDGAGAVVTQGTPVVAADALPNARVRTTFAGMPSFVLPVPDEQGFRLTKAAEQTLSATTLTVLQTRALAAAERPLPELVDTLRAEASTLAQTLSDATETDVVRSLTFGSRHTRLPRSRFSAPDRDVRLLSQRHEWVARNPPWARRGARFLFSAVAR